MQNAAFKVPVGAWDSHVHIFGPLERYPAANPDAIYAPPQEYDLAALQDLHNEAGIDHAVLVQPTAYGKDHSALVDALRTSPPGKYAGVAIIDDTDGMDKLRALHAAGVRGARFNFSRKFRLAPSSDAFMRTLDRIRELGWFVKIFGFGDDFLHRERELRAIDMPAIIDHLGGPDISKGTNAQAMQLVLDLLKQDNWWSMLSNGDRRSLQGAPWDDIVPFGKMLYQTAPDRCMWGSDWPHVHRFTNEPGEAVEHGVEHEKALLSLLSRYLPDEAAWCAVLAENPAAFFRKAC